MPIQKQGFNIAFGQGVDTKTDPFQVQAGKMLNLQNAVFNKGQLQKRNGFSLLTTIPSTATSTLLTLNGNLLATGSSLYAFSQDSNQWLNQGVVQPVDLTTLPLVRNSTSQSGQDSVTASSGLICTAYMDASVAYYQISDSVTGQIIVNRTALGSTAVNPRCFVLNRYFIITFGQTVAASPHLRYLAIPITTPTTPGTATDISSQISAINAAYDAVVANNTLYVAFNGADGGGAIRIHQMNQSLVVSSAKVVAGYTAQLMSVTADNTTPTPNLYVSWWTSTGNNGYTLVTDASRVTISGPTQIIAGIVINELTSVAQNMLATIFYQTTNTYSYSAVRSDFISSRTITQAGSLTAAVVRARSVGLASKAFINSDGSIYVMVVYGGAFQPTYFLMDSSGNILAKLAYSNGGGYTSSLVLPNVSIIDDSIQISYLIKDLLVPVNKTQGAATASGVFTQTGINLVTFKINTSAQYNSEIASVQHLTGGFLWEYDAVKPVEHNFHVWPEDMLITTSAAGGLITDQQYYYIFTYEWTDAAGMLHRSAPSIPVGQVTAGGNTSTNTIKVPTLRLTYKTGNNPVRIVGYRWSTAQQTYYQFTSITAPVVNDTTVDSVTFTDTLADSSILGNVILYTTGGIVEDIAAPACAVSTLFRSRLFVLDSEDRNLIWFSKQVISGTPVEMSDLFTIYIPPTQGAQGPTGPITALSAMDDKLIVFKKDAIYYITGNGPDNTGANNDFSDPVFITATAGCINPRSVVFQPQGIMFQSDKGIWMLGRDLSTQYIGAPVERYNDRTVQSALTVPGTNEVRINLDDGTVLMYDYYYQQWGTFVGVPGITSVLFNSLHTFVNDDAQVLQETLGAYSDNSNPVLLSFTTAWLKLTDLQGFQRAYCMNFLGTYITPHKINVQISYDYNPGISQTTLISPTNFNNVYGGDPFYGSPALYGGSSPLEQWRIFFNRQKCQSISLTFTEIYDYTLGIAPGAGFTMSGLNLVAGVKSSYPKLTASEST